MSLLHVVRLPLGLALKVTADSSLVEADALRVIEHQYPHIHAPFLVDYVASPSRHYIVSSWIDGDVASDVWEDLSESELTRLAQDIRSQMVSTRAIDQQKELRIYNASPSPISDVRMQWRDDPMSFDSGLDFSSSVWPGLDVPRRAPLREELRPLQEQNDVTVVFTHGDMAPWNIIFPGGLDKWRRGDTRVVLIDWECAGWMPIYWEALKMSWLILEKDNPH